MPLLFRERFLDITKHICGMCGKSTLEIVIIWANKDDPHEITQCSDPSCHHKYTDITHYDSKVISQRRRLGLL